MSEQNEVVLSCLSCNTTLQFKNASSYCLVCSVCQTLNFNQLHQEKPSELQKLEPALEEMSVIQLGATGTYQDLAFEVVGRIQYFFQERYRNYWFLHYQNGTTGWFGDWEGNYSLFSRVGVVRNKFENPAPGKKIQINNVVYLIEQIDVSRKFFGEGELGTFYLNYAKFITLELYHTSGELALAHIFNNKRIEAFVGEYLSLDELNLQNLRQHNEWV